MTAHKILFAIALVFSVVAVPASASAYYLQTLPTPTQNYYQYNVLPARPPLTPTLAPRPVQPLSPIAPVYTPSAPTLPSYTPTYYYNPYRPSIYSPYSGSNVSDYVLGLKKPFFITY